MRYLLVILLSVLCAAQHYATAGRRMEVETRVAGELEALLGDRLMTVEELTIRGPVNYDDFKTMKRISISGRLKDLNLTDRKSVV